MITIAVLGVVPTSWAQQHFAEPATDLGACADEPWHVDPAGVRAWWIWCGLLACVVTVVAVVYSKQSAEVRGNRIAKRMLVASIAMLVLVPPVGWLLGYMSVAMNCGL